MDSNRTFASVVAGRDEIPGRLGACCSNHVSRFTFPRVNAPASAFTLIEIMVVVALMMIVMSMGVPIVYKTFHKQPMTKALTDVVDICSAARARAILQGTMTEVVFHPQDGRLEVSGGAGAPGVGYTGGGVVEVNTPGSSSSASAQLSDRVMIDMLDINLSEYKEADEARVRFYPNGMCDEMTLILRGEGGEQRGVTLEITTSLPTILNADDLQNLRR
jgi:Tfp pilus assembly protein FimT